MTLKPDFIYISSAINGPMLLQKTDLSNKLVTYLQFGDTIVEHFQVGAILKKMLSKIPYLY